MAKRFLVKVELPGNVPNVLQDRLDRAMRDNYFFRAGPDSFLDLLNIAHITYAGDSDLPILELEAALLLDVRRDVTTNMKLSVVELSNPA